MAAEMRRKVTRWRKWPTTHSTLIRPLTRVRSEMNFEGGIVSICFPTHIAFVWLFASMCETMPPKGSIGVKLLLTNYALIWCLSTMKAHVSFETSYIREQLTTNSTVMRFVPGMGTEVYIPMTFLWKLLPTNITFKWFLSCVDAEMDYKFFIFCKPLPTLGTLVWCHAAMGPGVGVTKPISYVPLFSEFFSVIKTHVAYWISHLYSTGVAAAQLR